MYKSLSSAIVVLACGGAFAQIRPLPQNPLASPIAPVPAPAPSFATTPGTEVFVPQEGGATEFLVVTRGGTRSTTLRMEVSGPNPGNFVLADAPASAASALGSVALQPAPVSSALAEAPAVRRVVRVFGNFHGSQSRVADHRVTLIASDAGGREARHSFTVRFTRAGGAPRVDKIVEVSSAGYSSIGNPGSMPVNAFYLERADGGPVNFNPSDPGSEAICIYGSFRYACDGGPVATGGLTSKRLRIDVPDIGRGLSVQLVLKNPYGETRMPLTIRNEIATSDEDESYFVSNLLPHDSVMTVIPGTLDGHAGPGTTGTATRYLNSGPGTCGEFYKVWNDVTVLGARMDGPIVRGVTATLLSKPAANTPMTMANVPKVNLAIAAGVPATAKVTMRYKQTVRVGECAAKRR